MFIPPIFSHTLSGHSGLSFNLARSKFERKVARFYWSTRRARATYTVDGTLQFSLHNMTHTNPYNKHSPRGEHTHSTHEDVSKHGCAAQNSPENASNASAAHPSYIHRCARVTPQNSAHQVYSTERYCQTVWVVCFLECVSLG